MPLTNTACSNEYITLCLANIQNYERKNFI